MRDILYKTDDMVFSCRVDLDDCWVPLTELPTATVYPQALKPLLLADDGHIHHFVSREDA